MTVLEFEYEEIDQEGEKTLILYQKGGSFCITHDDYHPIPSSEPDAFYPINKVRIHNENVEKAFDKALEGIALFLFDAGEPKKLSFSVKDKKTGKLLKAGILECKINISTDCRVLE